jgi:hypothetical protein
MPATYRNDHCTAVQFPVGYFSADAQARATKRIDLDRERGTVARALNDFEETGVPIFGL